MRRFEQLMERPTPFWEVERDGSDVRTRQGVTGSEVTEHSESFAAPELAIAHVDALIADRQRAGFVEIKRLAYQPPEPSVQRRERFEWTDGYVKRWRELHQIEKWVQTRAGRFEEGRPLLADEQHEERCATVAAATARYEAWRTEARAARRAAVPLKPVTSKPSPRTRAHAAAPVNRALEAQCRAAPTDPAPWSVYADWLQGEGDPRGEIAALALAGHDAQARGAIETLFAPLWLSREVELQFDLVHGFARGVTIRFTHGELALDELVAHVLASPLCAFVDRVHLGLASTTSGENDWGPALAAVGAAPQARTLRGLYFDAWSRDDNEISWTPFGDLSQGWERLPALETLVVKAGAGGTWPAALELPKLRQFVRISGGLARAELARFCAARWPRLEHLDVWTGSRHYGSEIELADLAPLLAGQVPKPLRHLGIVNSELSDTIVPALAASTLLPRLDSLDLSHGIGARAMTEALVAHAPAFRHLASFDLSENVFFDDEIARIRAVLDNVITVDQRDARESDSDFDDTDSYRYVAVSE